jgi:hypothetical protein
VFEGISNPDARLLRIAFDPGKSTIKSISKIESDLLCQQFPQVTFYRVIARSNQPASHSTYPVFLSNWVAIDVAADRQISSYATVSFNRLLHHYRMGGSSKADVEKMVAVIDELCYFNELSSDYCKGEIVKTRRGWRVSRTKDKQSYCDVYVDSQGNIIRIREDFVRPQTKQP